MINSLKCKAQKLLGKADIEIDGNRPWDITIHNNWFYPRVFSQGALGLGESYVDRWWDCEQLDDFFYRLLSAEIDQEFQVNLSSAWNSLWARLLNLQTQGRAFNVGKSHYDRGNDLYRAMLDDRMVYTCGYWNQADNLNEAQEAKLELVCQKLNLQPGQTVLDIGCGWGSFIHYAAKNYNVAATGVTVSKEQVEHARELCKELPVKILLQDYRDVEGKFDHIISLGMFEHVGYKNYDTFMQTVRDHLKDQGLLLLHSIGSNKTVRTTNSWTSKYIFPNSMLPSIKQIGEAIEGQFVMEDWHNFGPDYDRTLMAWFENFKSNWAELQKRYSDRFYRMWKYYLLSSAGSFRARCLQLWQIVLSPKGISGGFQPPRYRTEVTQHEYQKT